MLNIATWVLVASAALALAEPIPLHARELAEPMPLEAREIESAILDTREPEDIELELRDIEARASKNITGLADFDTIVSGASITKQIGYYGGLQYQGIASVKPGLSGKVITGIKPFSGDNAAVYGPFTQLAANLPVITTQFSGSKTTAFSLKSFYFGCSTATVTGLLSVPARCKIALAGYSRSNKLLAYKAFNFNPGTGLSANMQLATLPSTFKNLDHVNLASTYGGITLGATLLDNIEYTITVSS